MGSLDLTKFNRLAPDEAERELRACCASRAWARRLAAGRPYPDLASLLARADELLVSLAWGDVLEALDAHPRIGWATTGPGRDVAWSRTEQSGVDTTDPATASALAEVNRAYEKRFGHVFLIFATGRTATEVLAAARQRLGNDAAAEREEVRAQLRRITRLRLERLVDP